MKELLSIQTPTMTAQEWARCLTALADSAEAIQLTVSMSVKESLPMNSRGYIAWLNLKGIAQDAEGNTVVFRCTAKPLDPLPKLPTVLMQVVQSGVWSRASTDVKGGKWDAVVTQKVESAAVFLRTVADRTRVENCMGTFAPGIKCYLNCSENKLEEGLKRSLVTGFQRRIRNLPNIS